MNSTLRIAALALAATLTACGTTGNIQPSPKPEAVGTTAAQKGQPAVDLSGYDKVVVLDFTDSTDKSKLKPDELHSYSEAMATNVRAFPDLIAQKLRETGAFQEVVRGPSPNSGKALTVSGQITRLVEGSGALRFWIGMGAGSSYFDATTDLTDAESGSNVGHIATGKNSWALGGAFAATQTVRSFMEGAAGKIADELRDGKKGPQAAKTH